ncbi:hypothetical protein [Streptomyces narbonensis]
MSLLRSLVFAGFTASLTALDRTAVSKFVPVKKFHLRCCVDP